MGSKLQILALFVWSGGKDSAMALYEIKKSRLYEISALLTTITEDYDRISMHGTRGELLDRQAEALAMRQEKVYITKDSSNEDYEGRMREKLTRYKDRGVLSVVFGDIFLEDLRRYREENLSKIGMNAVFPIWKRDTEELARAFVELGFKAVVTCVDTKVLDRSFAGRIFDRDFLSDLPSDIDPCGENGEFHTFVYDGPIFKEKVSYKAGETVLRDGRFYYCDLAPL